MKKSNTKTTVKSSSKVKKFKTRKTLFGSVKIGDSVSDSYDNFYIVTYKDTNIIEVAPGSSLLVSNSGDFNKNFKKVN